ncbi:FlgN protein [Moorella thermoacetica]|uniref:FlgN n=1 Tax=Moorella thermoacetica (strain ATCC 39073 / JCM 9320) TaxID=264732 RepID=Q2RKH6_MOOTA|nr:flagellar protein FlgN [Moorella thermoacetica]AKX93491.1 FlgN protein [Moorella thermoacetica]AKX96138.1 FlgN protein [Moorella thermoacetica]OIQ55350.1 FlgN protein [Moorella thermoacetica]OIQ60521.1 FlgN protein [Moorella thermoacetica]QCZ99948.1 FlgN protein [Moorella thermoacetica]
MRELADVLRDELAVLQELLTVGRQEQEALVTDELAGIQAATGRKEELARRLAALEEERQQVMEATPETSVAGAPVSRERGRDDDEINRLRDSLRQAVREFQEVNETNRLLARQSLAYVQKMLSLLLPEGVSTGIMDRLV